MKGNKRAGRAIFSEINVVPLVDVFLILMVILMVTANIQRITSIPIELPSSSAALPDKEDRQKLQITILDSGEVFLGTEPVDINANPEKLKEIIKQLIREQMTVPVMIRGDQNARHGVVVKVMSLVRESDPSGKHVQLAVVANKEKKRG